MFAAGKGHHDCVEILLAFGADPDIVTKVFFSCSFDRASMNHKPEISQSVNLDTPFRKEMEAASSNNSKSNI
tara:strand:- start:179 stop:394 length:216 start_codon:yes stop_codon:yes gene_type:complete